MSKREYQWCKEVKKGWMPFYNGHPYWPLFKTRKEAREYRRWKLGNGPKSSVERCEVITITKVRHGTPHRHADRRVR
jgi:hypothetical protein